MNQQQMYTIKFAGISAAEAGFYGNELRDILLDANPDVVVKQHRDDPRTQDFGSTLVLILGAPAVVSIANAIGNWLKLRNSASLTIEKDGNIIAQNLTSKDASRLAELFLSKE